MALSVTVQTHPLLDAGAFVARSVQPFVGTPTPAVAQFPFSPFPPEEAVKTAVRGLLRAGGFKPSGRSKPASEYLVTAHQEGRWPQISPLVDLCNVVSLHSGLPISVVDLDRITGDLAIQVAPPGTTYVFNPSGQTIDVSGLVCLCDAGGPTGTPVKDAQRTKTSDATTAAIIIVWGTTALPGRTRTATDWYRSLITQLPGASTEDVRLA